MRVDASRSAERVVEWLSYRLSRSSNGRLRAGPFSGSAQHGPRVSAQAGPRHPYGRRKETSWCCTPTRSGRTRQKDWAGIEVFRFHAAEKIEHWDVLQIVPTEASNAESEEFDARSLLNLALNTPHS